MATYMAPGVYIEEIPTFPTPVAAIETAIPAFIGYTEKAQSQIPDDLHLVPKKINSLLEYERYFGFPFPETGITAFIDATMPGNMKVSTSIHHPSPYGMHYGLQLYFANGGRYCYIVSVGTYTSNPVINAPALNAGLDAIAAVSGITLVVFPDALHLPNSSDYYPLYKNAMQQCAEKKDRFTIMDVWVDADKTKDNIKVLRDFDFGTVDKLKYGAAYYPTIYTTIQYAYEAASVVITATGDLSLAGTLAQLETTNNTCYQLVKKKIHEMPLLLPASGAVAGVYAMIDYTRGVWKAPANVNIALAKKPSITITDKTQEALNIDPAGGKSINAIRSFTGRGTAIIWGARTLAGNDPEWRYISVRRFFIMVEESVELALTQFVFESNAPATWVKVKSLVENFANTLWRMGALAGVTPKEAYFVHIGPGATMTALDLQEGRMIVEIGMAVVKPAEFISIRITQKMLSNA